MKRSLRQSSHTIFRSKSLILEQLEGKQQKGCAYWQHPFEYDLRSRCLLFTCRSTLAVFIAQILLDFFKAFSFRLCYFKPDK